MSDTHKDTSGEFNKIREDAKSNPFSAMIFNSIKSLPQDEINDILSHHAAFMKSINSLNDLIDIVVSRIPAESIVSEAPEEVLEDDEIDEDEESESNL